MSIYNPSFIVRISRAQRMRAFTMIEVMIVVAILGILAAIAIPALTKFMRRAKTSEARIQLAKLFDGTSAFFNEEHVERGQIALLGAGGNIATVAPHRCPVVDPTQTSGKADPLYTPNAVNCNDGPGGHCVPGVGGTGPGAYDLSEWSNNRVWNDLNFQQEQAHFFHYNFVAANGDTTGYGNCMFTAQAFGDLDNDGVLSTFERSGSADFNGVNGAAGLYIDNEVE